MPFVDYLDANRNAATASSAAGLPATLSSLLAGENQTFNRLMGGAVCKYAIVGADTAVSATPAILYGIFLLSAGTMASVYDNASAASGNAVIPSTTASYHFNGAGILMNNGIFCDWTSGSWLVVYVN